MPKSELTPQNYYDNYAYSGWDLSLMYERFSLVKSPQDIEPDFREKDKAKFLILGSATPRNLSQVARLDKYMRPDKVEQGEVFLIDQNVYPLMSHKWEISVYEGKSGWGNMPLSTKEFPLPSYKLAQADMRSLPFRDSSFDCIISDYTLNYVDNLEDTDKTFAEVSRTLTSSGMLLISIRGTEDDVKEKQEKNLGGVTVHYFPLQSYFNSARNHGLDVDTIHQVGNDIFAIIKFKHGQVS